MRLDRPIVVLPGLCRVSAAALVLSAGLAGALGLGGCDDRPIRGPFNRETGPQIALGDASQYKPTGLYLDHVDTHDVALVSRDVAAGQMLVALDFRCTYDEQALMHNDLTDRFECRRCDSRWSSDGLIQSGSVANKSLDRYRIRLSGGRQSAKREVYVDMSRRFHHTVTRDLGGREVTVHEWSATDSMYHFEDDPRVDALAGKIKVD